MKICEIEGRIQGFECNPEEGFLFHGSWQNIASGCYYHSEVIRFPYNVNMPKSLNLNAIRDKKFKMTIEIIEEDKNQS